MTHDSVDASIEDTFSLVLNTFHLVGRNYTSDNFSTHFANFLMIKLNELLLILKKNP